MNTDQTFQSGKEEAGLSIHCRPQTVICSMQFWHSRVCIHNYQDGGCPKSNSVLHYDTVPGATNCSAKSITRLITFTWTTTGSSHGPVCILVSESFMEKERSMRHGVMRGRFPHVHVKISKVFWGEFSEILYKVNDRPTRNLHPQNFTVNSQDFRRIGPPAIQKWLQIHHPLCA